MTKWVIYVIHSYLGQLRLLIFGQLSYGKARGANIFSHLATNFSFSTSVNQ